MKPAEVMYQLRELQTDWRRQDFHLTGDQRRQYSNLLELRRERVKELYAEGRVWKGKSNVE